MTSIWPISSYFLETEYSFVAYVTTIENKTFYGEQRTFLTGNNNNSDVQYEDVNNDGKTDTQDVLAIYRFMQNSDGDKSMYDVNYDGNVDTQDVLGIYQYMQQQVKRR